MRVRTEVKRREILESAAALFVEQGFERTSMSAIAERVGGSKTTLYGYFESKEDLLRAVLSDSVSENTERLVEVFPAGEDLRVGFVRLGTDFLKSRLGPVPIASLRILANQPEEAGLGAEYYANSLKPAWDMMATRLAALMEQGRLRKADPWTAAMHWKGLNEGELLERSLLGAFNNSDDSEIERIANAAADAFLRIYASPD